MDCIFCKIANGEIPATSVYEDAETLAFLDIKPNNPGHTLVIPKTHTANIYEIGDDALIAIMKTVKRVASAVKSGLKADGVNIAMNNDQAAGQIIFHTHVHIIPRFRGDGYTHWPQKEYREGEEDEVAEKIRSAIA